MQVIPWGIAALGDSNLLKLVKWEATSEPFYPTASCVNRLGLRQAAQPAVNGQIDQNSKPFGSFIRCVARMRKGPQDFWGMAGPRLGIWPTRRCL